MSIRRRTIMRWAVALSALALSSCGREQAPARPAGRPPVVLISIDTLRSDHLPAYGYAAVETPAIDRLRADSILFQRAYSQVPLTLPSHSTLLSGALPAEHGVRDNLGQHLEAQRLEKLAWLPRLLKGQGYTTGGFVSSYVLRGATGISLDFDRFDEASGEAGSLEGRLQRPATETLAAALPWLREVSDRPFFLFFHLYDPHKPHEAPEPFASRYPLLYDAEIAYADSAVGKLLDELRRLDRYDRSLVILLSDHGEGLDDHGEDEHGVFLYREALQVPLLVKLPGGERAGEAISAPVGLLDVVPTVLDVLGLEPQSNAAGRSLLATPSQAADERPIYSETFYPRLHFGWHESFSLIGPRYHYIDAPRPELYDLIDDPAEQNNLVAGQRAQVTRFRRELDGYDRELGSTGPVDPAVRERLAALGYLGTVADREGPLPDAKDHVEILRALREAFEKESAHEHVEAVRLFRQVLDREPQMLDAWEAMARSLRKLGRSEEALAAFQEAMRLSHGNAQIALQTANLLIEMERWDEAREYALLALETAPEAEALLARVDAAGGDERSAEEHLAAVAEKHPVIAKVQEAELALKAEKWQQAYDLSLEAERLFGDRPNRKLLRGLFLTRGRALVQLGRPAEAEKALLTEVQIAPENLLAYTHLALLYALQGNGPKTGATLQLMVETNPTPLAYAEAVRTLRYIGDPSSAAGLLRQAIQRWPDDQELRRLAEDATPGA